MGVTAPSAIGAEAVKGSALAPLLCDEDKFYQSRTYETQPDYDKTGCLRHETKTRKPDVPIVISDGLYGEGRYVLVGQERQAEIVLESVHCFNRYHTQHKWFPEPDQQKLPLCESTNGSIAFACGDVENARRIVTNLIQLEFCASFEFSARGCREMALCHHVNGDRLLLLQFDTESG
jgi:hypothetical protein